MTKKKNRLIIPMLIVLALAAVFLAVRFMKNRPVTPASSDPVPRKYTLKDLDSLERTENFADGTLEHIFNGTVNSSGNGSGYHYDMIEDSDGYIVEGTRSEKDEYGVYTANIEVSGKKKSHYSTFFPDEWSPQEVVDAINAAREDAMANNRKVDSLWIGYYEGIEIDMYMTKKGKITTAYPVYITERTKIDD